MANWYDRQSKASLAAHILSQETEIARLTAALERAVSQVSDLSTKLGQAEGKLLASETHGVVEEWKRRAEAAEKALAEADARSAALVAGAYEAAAGECADQFSAHMIASICGEPDNSRTREASANMAERLLHRIRALTPADAIRALAQKEAGE